MIAIWDQRLSVGDGSIDAEHRQVINLLNEIDVALTVQAPREVIERAIEALVVAIERHFSVHGTFLTGEEMTLLTSARRLFAEWREGRRLTLDRRVLTHMAARWVGHMGRRTERMSGGHVSAISIQQQRMAG